MEIQQTRKQFFYKPSGRVKHIRAWELLIQRATACHYHKRLEDRSIAGVRHCIRAWLTMEDIEFIDDGKVIVIEGEFALEVLGTHRSNNILPSSYGGHFEHVKVYSLWDFLTWFDRIFTINF